MTSLQSLAKSIKERIYPGILQRVYTKKKNLQKWSSISVVLIIASWGLGMFLPKEYGVWIAGIGGSVGMIGVMATLMMHTEIAFCYKNLLKLEDDDSLGSIPFLYLDKQEHQLTQSEMEALLSIALSDENLKILNEAISANGYIVYDDVIDMRNEEQYETEALQNHVQFIENGNYTNTQQQQNLQKLASLNTAKLTQNYKTFNSKAVL